MCGLSLSIRRFYSAAFALLLTGNSQIQNATFALSGKTASHVKIIKITLHAAALVYIQVMKIHSSVHWIVER